MYTRAMSSLPPAAGVPSGGNGKYILLALLLLGGVVGVIVWARSHSAPPAQVGPIPSSAFPSRKTEDSVPLPVAVEDSGAPAPKAVQVAPSNGCEKTCSGSASPEIETALAQRAKQSRVCYDKALATDPTLKGKMTLHVKIGTNGSVCAVNVASNDIGNDFIAQCATNLFRTSAFANPKGGCVEATIPLNFQPR